MLLPSQFEGFEPKFNLLDQAFDSGEATLTTPSSKKEVVKLETSTPSKSESALQWVKTALLIMKLAFQVISGCIGFIFITAYKRATSCDSWKEAGEKTKFFYISNPIRHVKLVSDYYLGGKHTKLGMEASKNTISLASKGSRSTLAIVKEYPKDAELFLGCQPNKCAVSVEDFKKGLGVKEGQGLALFSLIEEWALENSDEFEPYVCGDLSGNDSHRHIEAGDHIPLSSGYDKDGEYDANKNELDKAATWIHNQLEAGKKVYVHCAAGHGRSGMAIAAYLIKYKGMMDEEAKDFIKSMRKDATVHKENKMKQLQLYARWCTNNGY